jgi:hypothetical protein
MSRSLPAICAASLLAPALAWAAQPDLERYQSPVFRAQGARSEIAAQGLACLASLDRPRDMLRRQGQHTVVTASEAALGVVVATTEFVKDAELTLRATLVIEARDGRFRLTYSNIEARRADEWTGVDRFLGASQREIAASLNQNALQLATCVIQGAAADW